MTSHRKILAVFISILSWSGGAAASQEYPGLIQEELDMPCVPQCTLCHRDANGGRGTVVTPFGLTMMDEGLRDNAPGRVPTALEGVLQGEYDSDGDGRGDIEELREGSSPNQAGDGLLCVQYGCGASIASKPRAHRALILSFACMLGFGLRRLRLGLSRRVGE